MGYWVTLIVAVMSSFGCAHRGPTNGEAVILIHGFGRSNSAMSSLSDQIEEAGYEVHRVGYSSLTQDIDGIRDEVSEKILDLSLDGAKRVHFVGHSLGGLLIRDHLGRHDHHNLGYVVNLGSPSRGTPVVDQLRDEWWFGLAGPAVLALSARGSPFLDGLPSPHYALGIIAGNVGREGEGDVIPGVDDGVVPLASTPVKGMKEYLVIPSSHYRLRRHPQAVGAILQFLKSGSFRSSR